ncbi:phosphomevalonate kinase [Zalerion maritima]|uniref:Phosphomevalonate kinase n=1 Tax=Zalerion maritima TaxID=339359 RepID=A0AAD5RWZ3_9PEZI|nr:phosphomevalonate kinase [Zalerion maritima]
MPAGTGSRIKAFSAPGKVLLAGGYLVLDRDHNGLVFGLNARVNVVVQGLETSPGVQLNEIIVKSPQFMEAEWRYGYHLAGEDGGIQVTQLQVDKTLAQNKFVETTLSYVLTYLNRVSADTPSHAIPSTQITILADNDYYSHGDGTTTVAELNQNPHHPHHPHGSRLPHDGRFKAFASTLGGAHKTGLGSSAALVTSLVGALLSFHLPKEKFDISIPGHRQILHNLAQAAHCAAQGKIGSGFDVAAAVYGSCLYKRFSSSTIAQIPSPGNPGFGTSVYDTVTAGWDTEIKKGEGTGLRAGFVMRMADVDCGSSTVSMVKNVMMWRKEHPEASTQLWVSLQAANDILGKAIESDLYSESEVRAAFLNTRALLREMGDAAGVPIEPQSQKELLDAVSHKDGVLGGVVPGAGGYDAIALLVKDNEETKHNLEAFFEGWREDTGTNVKLLDVIGEVEGARLEDKLDQYRGWIYG